MPAVFDVLGLVDNPRRSRTKFLDDAVVRNVLAVHIDRSRKSRGSFPDGQCLKGSFLVQFRTQSGGLTEAMVTSPFFKSSTAHATFLSEAEKVTHVASPGMRVGCCS